MLVVMPSQNPYLPPRDIGVQLPRANGFVLFAVVLAVGVCLGFLAGFIAGHVEGYSLGNDDRVELYPVNQR